MNQTPMKADRVTGTHRKSEHGSEDRKRARVDEQRPEDDRREQH
jgi:hypothetical protein